MVTGEAGYFNGSIVVVFLFTIFVIGPRIGSELIPEVHQGEFNLELTLPVGTPAEDTDVRVKPIEDFVSGLPEVAKVASVIGIDKKESTNTDEGEHTAKLTVTLIREGSTIDLEESAIGAIRAHMADFSGIESKISRPTLFSFKTPVEVEVHGYNLIDLQSVANTIADQMKNIPGLFDVRANIQRGNPEVQYYI